MKLKKNTHCWNKTYPLLSQVDNQADFMVSLNFPSILSVNLIFAYIVERYAYCMYMHLCSVITVHWEVTRKYRMAPTVRTLSLCKSTHFFSFSYLDHMLY